MKIIFSPKKYDYDKDLSHGDEQGLHTRHDVYAVGERVCLLDSSSKTIVSTKGNKNQILSTIPRHVLQFRKISGRSLVLPGFNHDSYYHMTADFAYQCYKASQYDRADHVILPVALKDKFPVMQEMVRSLGLSIYYIHTPREALALETAVFFDPHAGRFGELACQDAHLPEVKRFFEYVDAYFDKGEPIAGYEKLFSTRQGNDSRLFEGMSDIEERYRQRGYKIVYFGDKTIEEQIQLSRSAIQFAGFHGANLTNLLFAHRCEEMEEVVSCHSNNDFQSLCYSRNIKHQFIRL